MSERAAAAVPPDGASGPLTVLLVDDKRAERLMLESFLQAQGHRVRIAEDGIQAVELFDEDEIDLVLMDVILPELDGFETTRHLKARCRERWVPVILLSALRGAADETRALEAGADDYINKPLSLAVLAARLRSFQRIAHTNRTLAQHRTEAQAEIALAAAMIEGISRHQPGLRDPALTWVVRPSHQFSGDVVAAARTPSGSLIAMLADATGHGLPAAISLLPMLQVFYGMARKDLRVPEMATEMNRRLKEYAPVGVYLAAALVALHPRDQQVEIWNGGIPGGLWLREGVAEAAPSLAPRHLPLGILEEGEFDAGCVLADMRCGGSILFFSDGVIDATDPGGQPVGVARLCEQLAGAGPQEALARAVELVEEHLGGRTAHDDISLMLLALDA